MNIPSTWQENISALRICPCQSAPVVEQRRNPIHTINENQEVGSRIQEQPEGLQHLGLASGRRDEDLEGGAAVAAAAAAAAAAAVVDVVDVVVAAAAVVVALACETLAHCRSRRDRQNRLDRHVLRLLGRVG